MENNIQNIDKELAKQVNKISEKMKIMAKNREFY